MKMVYEQSAVINHEALDLERHRTSLNEQSLFRMNPGRNCGRISMQY